MLDSFVYVGQGCPLFSCFVLDVSLYIGNRDISSTSHSKSESHSNGLHVVS